MILAFVQNSWTLFLLFIFIFLPICFFIGLCKELSKNKEEPVKEEIKLEKEQAVKETEKFDIPVTEVYKTVKKEPGSYIIIGPDKTEAVVVKATVPGDGNIWIAALAIKNNQNSVRVSTKKEAVAAAIEMLKEYKEKKNGS